MNKPELKFDIDVDGFGNIKCKITNKGILLSEEDQKRILERFEKLMDENTVLKNLLSNLDISDKSMAGAEKLIENNSLTGTEEAKQLIKNVKTRKENNMDHKKKLFVSLPMRGLTDEEIVARQEKLLEPYKDKYELMDTVSREDPPNPDNPVWYLGGSIQMLGDADLVIFASNWAEAPGCRIERMVCALYAIKYVEEDSALDFIEERR